MKTTIFSFLLLSCFGFHYLSKNNTNELVEIAPDFFVEAPLVDSYKTKKIHEVFRKLKAAKGDYRSHKPALHLVQTTGKGIAVAYQLSGVIKLEEKGFDLCGEFGPDAEDALAILLAHELIHVYEKHSWENLFAWEYSHTSLKNAVTNERKKDEIQADYLGGVLAYQAGYKVFGIMPKFLDKVYASYGLEDEKMSDYPGLKDRKLFAVESEDKFRYFTNIFEMANLLVIKEEYGDALTYYDQVLQDFKSREVYNNIGVVSLQAALQHFSPKQNKFGYPVELDVVSRMEKGGRGEVDATYRERKLLDAIHFFEMAKHFDPFYPIAHLNKACANALLGVAKPAASELEWMDAEVSAKRAVALSEEKPKWKSTLSDGHVVLGILAALKNEKEEAIGFFDQALQLEKGHILAKANKNALESGEYPFAATGDLGANGGEVIDDMPFSKMKFGKNQFKFGLRKSTTDSIALWRLKLPNSYLLTHQPVKGDPSASKRIFHMFHVTKEGYAGKTAKGITLENGSYETITEKYGSPHDQFRLGNGSYLRYEFKDQELIFHLRPDGKLLRWFIYKYLEVG